MYMIKQMIELYKTLDAYLIQQTEEAVKEELFENVEELKGLSEKELDFIVRPIVASLLMSEIEKDKIQELSSIDGIVASKMSDEDKYNALKKYALNLGLNPISKTWQSLLKELVYFIQNNWSSLKTPIINQIFDLDTDIYKIYIADSNSREMVRNEMPLTRFPDTLLNNYQKDDTNSISLISHSFSRKELEDYQKAIKENTLRLPNFIDIYMLFNLKTETINVSKNKKNNLYTLPKNMYIDVSHKTKALAIKNSDLEFYFGITEKEVECYIEDGGDSEDIEIIYYQYELPTIDSLTINNSNILFKGFFPFLVDLTILTEETISEDKNLNLLNDLQELFNNKAYDLYISVEDINKVIRNYYSDGACSTNIEGKLFLSVSSYEEKNISFPVSVLDLKINTEFPKRQVSKNTIAVFLNSIKVSNEN